MLAELDCATLTEIDSGLTSATKSEPEAPPPCLTFCPRTDTFPASNFAGILFIAPTNEATKALVGFE